MTEVTPKTREGLNKEGGVSINYDEYQGERVADHQDPEGDQTGSTADQEELRSASVTGAIRTLMELDNERQLLISERDEETAGRREGALFELGESGSMSGLLALDSKIKEELELDAEAIIGRGMSHLANLVELFTTSLRRSSGTEEVFDVTTIVTMLEDSRHLLTQCKGDICKVGKMLRDQGTQELGGGEYYDFIYHRLDVLLGTLTRRYTKTALGVVFPQKSAEEIIDWYLTMNVLLVEVLRNKEMYRNSVRDLGGLLARDPHPRRTPERKVEQTVVSSLKTTSSKKELASVLGLGYRQGGMNMASTFIREAEQNDQQGVAQRPSFAFATRRQDSTDPIPNQIESRKKIPAEKLSKAEAKDTVSVLSTKSVKDHDEDEEHSFGTVTILGEIENFAEEKLKKGNKWNDTTMDIIRSNVMENSRFTPGRSMESKFMSSFDAMQKKIDPDVEGQYVNVAQWLALLNDQGTSFGIPIKFLFQFLKDTGGLKVDHCKTVQKRVKDMFKTVHQWLREYKPTHDVTDDRYWMLMWTGAQVKLIMEFWVTPNSKIITEGLKKLTKALTLVDEVDPVNNEFYLVHNLYDAMIIYLTDRNALFGTSFMRCVQMIRDRLVQNDLSPGGIFIDQHIGNGIQQMTTDPGRFLGKNHGLDEEELNELVMKGENGWGKVEYAMMWETLLSLANQRALSYTANTLTQFKGLSKETQWKTKEAKKQMANAAKVSSEADALVLAVSGGTPAPVKTYTKPCSTCDMYHTRGYTGPCTFVDAKGKISIKGMLSQEGVLQRRSNGTWFLSQWFKKKLTSFGFEKLGLTTSEAKNKLLDDLEKVAKSIEPCDKLPETLRIAGAVAVPDNSKSVADKLKASHKKVLLLEKKLEEVNKAAKTAKVVAAATKSSPQVDEEVDDGQEWDPETQTWGDAS
jgi:hypothetical protein